MAFGIDGLFRFAVDATDCGDASVRHRNVGAIPRSTRTIDDGAVLDDEVVAHISPLARTGPCGVYHPSPFRTRLATFQLDESDDASHRLRFLIALFAGSRSRASDRRIAGDASARAEFADAYKTFKRLNDEGKNEEALPTPSAHISLGLQIYGENHSNTAALALNLGETYDKTGHRKEAVRRSTRPSSSISSSTDRIHATRRPAHGARNATGRVGRQEQRDVLRAGTRHRAR